MVARSMEHVVKLPFPLVLDSPQTTPVNGAIKEKVFTEADYIFESHKQNASPAYESSEKINGHTCSASALFQLSMVASVGLLLSSLFVQ